MARHSLWLATRILSGLGLASVLVAAPAAWAAATYASSARSSFTLLDVGPLTAVVDHAPAEGSSSVGSATASIVKSLSSADGVHPATIDSAVSGTAAAPPFSTSSAFVQRGHVFTIDRTSPSGPLPEVTIPFRFEIAWAALLSIDLPGTEIASGGAYFAISGFEPGIDSIEIDAGMPGTLFFDAALGHFRWDFNPGASQLAAGPLGDGIDTTITGRITVFAGRVGEFSVITDVAGSASARPIPVPAPWLLMLAGALFAGARLRRPA